MSFFDDEMNEIISEVECFATTQDRPATVYDVMNYISKRYDEVQIKNGKAFNFIDLMDTINKNSDVLDKIIEYNLDKFLLRSILNKEKKYIQKINVEFFVDCVIDYINYDKLKNITSNVKYSYNLNDDNGEEKIRNLKNKYKKFYSKYGKPKNIKKNNEENENLSNLTLFLIWSCLIIAIFYPHFQDSIKFNNVKNKIFEFYRDTKEFPSSILNSINENNEKNFDYQENDFPKKCDDEYVLNFIYQYAYKNNANYYLSVSTPGLGIPLVGDTKRDKVRKDGNLILQHIVQLEYNEKTDFVKCKAVMYADFGEYGMSPGKGITYTIEKTTENLPYVSIFPGRLLKHW